MWGYGLRAPRRAAAREAGHASPRCPRRGAPEATLRISKKLKNPTKKEKKSSGFSWFV